MKLPAVGLSTVLCSPGDHWRVSLKKLILLGVITHAAGYVGNSVPLLFFSIRSVMQKYLEERNEITFDKIFNQKIGESCLVIWHTVIA